MKRSILRHPRLLCTTAMLACINAMAQSPSGGTSFEYDALGNLKLERNALEHTLRHDYDALSRPEASFDPYQKRSLYGYDLSDQLTKFTDARNVVTGYSIDGLGKLTQTSSGDTGITITDYDEAGNLVLSTDAKKQTTRFEYDVLNRIKLITYADATTVLYVYDLGVNAIGRLARIADVSGSTEYGYDKMGNVIAEVRTIGGATFSTGYRYDSYGRLEGINYPSGRSIDYEFDSLGRIAKIHATKGGVSKLVVADVGYLPFGNAEKITFGNGRSQKRTYDLDGRLESYSLGDRTMVVSYDSANRVRRVANAALPTMGMTFDYDKADRLTGVTSPVASQVFGYDDVGNRTSRQINGNVKTMSYALTSNRLTAIGVQPIVTDDNGSITSRGDGTFRYDARGRLISFQGAIGLINYTINSLGQRVMKVTPTTKTVFHYDTSGKLIAEETTESGSTKIREYVYLGNLPVAVLK